MIFLSKIKGYLIAGAAFMAAFLAVYLKGRSDAKQSVREKNLEMKIKINDALSKKQKQNEAQHHEQVKKAKSGDFSGFNRKPDGMRNKR